MDNQKFGAFVAALRKEKGWTQQELANQLNVTAKAVSKWECGSGFPDVKTLEPLADALGVSVLELMRGERISEQAVPTENAKEAVSEVLKAAAFRKKEEKLRMKEFMISLLIFTAGILIIFNSTNIGRYQATSFLKAMGGSMDISSYNTLVSSCSSGFRAIGFAIGLFAIALYLRSGKRN